MAKRDYYEVLGVERDSSDRDVAKAYRKLAVRFHPDSNPGDEEASQGFKEAAEAYEVLSDPEKRSRYDRHGHAGVDGSSQFGSAEDIFAALLTMFGLTARLTSFSVASFAGMVSFEFECFVEQLALSLQSD